MQILPTCDWHKPQCPHIIADIQSGVEQIPSISVHYIGRRFIKFARRNIVLSVSKAILIDILIICRQIYFQTLWRQPYQTSLTACLIRQISPPVKQSVAEETTLTAIEDGRGKCQSVIRTMIVGNLGIAVKSGTQACPYIRALIVERVLGINTYQPTLGIDTI